jgi:hypothetical protein
VAGTKNPKIGNGFGCLAGIGYAFPTGATVRPIVNLNYMLNSITSGDPTISQGIYQAVNLDVGLLW